MNAQWSKIILELAERAVEFHNRIERLEGVKGPEQSLVRESRSDEQPDGAEERKERSDCSEERSGVRKIVERTELMRQIDRMIDEAQRQMTDTYTKDANKPYYTAMGRSSALIDLKIWLCDIAEKRSDLPNSKFHNSEFGEKP